jgi:uracil-DNA glycosylase
MNDPTDPAARIRLHDSWKQRLLPQLLSPQMQALREFLRREIAAGKEIYPPAKLIFNALEHTPFERVQVVILGQDPYHGPGQAQGLCFSVPPGIDVPPSLVNIYAELKRDLGIEAPDHGCLIPWADRGVLLLNAVLTVERGRAGAHQGKGWESFTDRIVDLLNEEREGLVFLLWGAYAQAKGKLVDARRHLVLRAPHPSPLSAYRGFIGCGHFSRANAWLKARGGQPIDWRLPPAQELGG